jgi:hypothetical protein
MGPAFHLARTGDDRQRPDLTESDRADGNDRHSGDRLIQDGFLCGQTMQANADGINPLVAA